MKRLAHLFGLGCSYFGTGMALVFVVGLVAGAALLWTIPVSLVASDPWWFFSAFVTGTIMLGRLISKGYLSGLIRLEDPRHG